MKSARRSDSRARELLDALVEERRRLVGAQLVASVGDTFLYDLAVGEALPGRAMEPDTIQSLYCLTKPIVATATCLIAEQHGIDLDADLSRSSPRVAHMLGGFVLSLRDVLSHAAGLHPMRAADVMFLPRPDRERATTQLVIDVEASIGTNHTYSEFQGWNLLRIWLEDVSGVSFGTCVERTVCEPLGLRDVYFGSDGTWPALQERLGVHYEVNERYAKPLVHELLRKHLDDPAMQAIGGHASARDIARFYGAVRRGLRESVPGLPNSSTLWEMATATAPPAVDPVLTSTVSFGLGFMTNLSVVLSESLGPRAFGHLGLLGHSFAFVDPECDLVVVFCSNGFLVDDRDRQQVRAALCDAIYEDVMAAAV
jgi:CubicO group peptidase (beta-lactamase class C family)